MFAELTHGSNFQQYVSLLHDVPHICFELTLEIITAIPSIIYARYWVQRHDRKEHPNVPEEA